MVSFFFFFFLLFSSPNFSGRRLDVYHIYFYTWCGPRANLKCRSEMCWARLAGNAGPKKSPKIRHLGTIAQLSRAVSLQLRHISTIGKNVKQQRLPHMSSQYGELRPTSGWDLLASLGHTSKFQRVSRLGSVTARHSSSQRQANFATLNRGRHLYSTGRPSCWALTHSLLFTLHLHVRQGLTKPSSITFINVEYIQLHCVSEKLPPFNSL